MARKIGIDKEKVIELHNRHFKVHYSDDCELSPYRWESATTIEKEEAEKDCFDN